MLVLSRQKDETIMIGDDVEITVVDIRGDKVRLGIKAPPHIPVHRKEVYEAIQQENRAAANVSPDDIQSVSTTGIKPVDSNNNNSKKKKKNKNNNNNSREGMRQ